jgi:hypothetical protein
MFLAQPRPHALHFSLPLLLPQIIHGQITGAGYGQQRHDS